KSQAPASQPESGAQPPAPENAPSAIVQPPGVLPPPAATPETKPQPAGADAEVYTFGPFKEPVEVTTLVDFARDEFGLPLMALDDNLKDKKVVLPVPIKVRKDRMLRFLTWILEMKGSTIVRGEGGVYVIQQLPDVQPTLGDDAFNMTQIIPTRGLRPSSLQTAIVTLGISARQVDPGGAPAKGQPSITSLDELGMIIVTATPRITAQISDLIDRLVEEEANIKPIRLGLRHVAASYARDQLLTLMGISAGRTTPRI